jgi:hypothetical protein
VAADEFLIRTVNVRPFFNQIPHEAAWIAKEPCATFVSKKGGPNYSFVYFVVNELVFNSRSTASDKGSIVEDKLDKLHALDAQGAYAKSLTP